MNVAGDQTATTGCVFLGPTLEAATARALAPVTPLPPAAVGDVYRAVLAGYTTVLLVDGYFHRVPSVQHKEIIFALSRGVRVLGCSSMGALRAAELAAYGMVGVGEVFGGYRDGRHTDDDEVAVAHADAEHGYRALSTAMVTIRHGLAAARRDRVISPDTAEKLTTIAKQLFYADRHWGTLVGHGRVAGLPDAELSGLLEFVGTRRPDPKRADAIEALRLIAHGGAADMAPPSITFEPTYSWSVLIADESTGER